MLLLQAFFLWAMISGLVLGGAFLFHRLLPNESPWFGFLIPPLVFVIFFNFIEHLVSVPSLLLLLPVLLAPLILLVVAPYEAKEKILLPSLVFVASFAFTFLIRCLQPDITASSDGISDLNMVNNFSQGGTLPPPDTWMPPFRHEWYYSMQHYAASLVERLLNLKIGVAYNLSHALLSALTCVAAAGAGYRLSGGRVWVALAMLLLIESAATGSSAYIMLTASDPSLWLSSDLSGAFGGPSPPDGNILWKILGATDHHHETLRLQVPGFWTWRDEYHANASGHFLTLLSIFTLAELAFLRRTLCPWVMTIIIPVLAVTASAWAFPITFLLCLGGLFLAICCGRRPSSWTATLVILFVAMTLLWPAFYSATSSPAVPPMMRTQPEWRVPILQFLIQWWPIIALWIGGILCWRQIGFNVRWVLFVVPVMLIGIELITIDSRYNTIEKMWGYTWGAGLVSLFPIIASRRGLVPRLLTVVLLLSAMVSLFGFCRVAIRDAGNGVAFHLEGSHYLTIDDQKRRMMQIMAQVKHTTFLSGETAFCYNEAPALATFTNNRSYIAWFWFESLTNFQDEADYRNKLETDFYSGAMTDRLQFLQSNNIAGVLVWPGDDLSNDFVDGLKRDLGPTYDYIDCRGNGDKNAGVFLLRPLANR